MMRSGVRIATGCTCSIGDTGCRIADVSAPLVAGRSATSEAVPVAASPPAVPHRHSGNVGPMSKIEEYRATAAECDRMATPAHDEAEDGRGGREGYFETQI